MIGLVGPNAIGKTTAVKRWCLRYHGLVGALADDQREIDWRTAGGDHRDLPVNARGWKGTVEEKAALVAAAREREEIVVVDSARTTALEALLPGEHVLMVVCEAQTLMDNLRQRAEERGKKFDEEYWSLKKCGYESMTRYTNFRSRCRGTIALFRVDDRERDWPVVDRYFGNLYRRLWNGRGT